MLNLKRIEKYFISIAGKKIGFLGLGVSNLPLARMYSARGFEVSVRDRRSHETIGKVADELESAGIRLILGDGYLDGIYEDILFRSPGMRYDLPELCAAREAGTEITSEIEMFFEFCPCKTYGITGSDGKTTTSTIIAKMLTASGRRVFLGGNIGTPLFPLIETIEDGDVAVVELSSFQLITMKRSPDVAVMTNIAPNHLDIHKSMEEYIDAKRNIYRYQTADNRVVINYDNPYLRPFGYETKAHTYYFSRRQPVCGAYCDVDGNIICRGVPIMNAAEIRVPGAHNVENFLAAFAAVEGDVSPEIMAGVARSFSGVEHRLELVRELDGVKWYNDSKATTPTSCRAALSAMKDNVILIAGGSDKQTPFEPLAPDICSKVRMLVLSGKTADKIEAAVRGCHSFNSKRTVIYRSTGMEDSVKTAWEHSREGDTVLLSPACASFDFYKCFEERGDHFKSLVKSLPERK